MADETVKAEEPKRHVDIERRRRALTALRRSFASTGTWNAEELIRAERDRERP